jgi:hypothetical protein
MTYEYIEVYQCVSIFIVVAKLGFKFEWCKVLFSYTQNKILQVTIVLFKLSLNLIVVVRLQTILFEQCTSAHLLLIYRDNWHSESSQPDKWSQNLNVIESFLNNAFIGMYHKIYLTIRKYWTNHIYFQPDRYVNKLI